MCADVHASLSTQPHLQAHDARASWRYEGFRDLQDPPTAATALLPPFAAV